MPFVKLNKLGQIFPASYKKSACSCKSTPPRPRLQYLTLHHGLFIFVGDNDADKCTALWMIGNIKPTRNMRIIAAIATLCSLMSCGRNSVNTNKESSPIIEALMTLKGQTNKHAFVIAEDPSSERYVQFSVKDSKEVIFNFPIRLAFLGASQKLLYNIVVTSIPADAESKQSVFMPSDEVGRLQALLRERRLPFETQIRAGHNGDFKIQGYMETLQGTLPDLMEGQRFVDDVFSKVYLLKPPGTYTLQTH